MGVGTDILSFIHLMNYKGKVTVIRDTDPFLLTVSNLVKQGPVLGPVLNNCSLNKFFSDGIEYIYGTSQIKPMEDIKSATLNIQYLKTYTKRNM